MVGGSSNVDGSGGPEGDSSREEDFTKRDDTSRVSNRGLVDNSFNFQRKKKRAGADNVEDANIKGGKATGGKGGKGGACGSSVAASGKSQPVGKRPPHPMN
jgi:hypothetical protein